MKMIETVPVRRFRRGDLVEMTTSTQRRLAGVVWRVAHDNAWVEVKWRAGMAEWGTRIPPQRLALVDPAPPRHHGRISAQTLTRYAHSGAHLDDWGK
jgi:hypothetical protein